MLEIKWIEKRFVLLALCWCCTTKVTFTNDLNKGYICGLFDDISLNVFFFRFIIMNWREELNEYKIGCFTFIFS